MGDASVATAGGVQHTTVETASLQLRGGRRLDVRRRTRTFGGVGESSYELTVANTVSATAITGTLDERERAQLLAALEGAAPPSCHGCERHERRRRWTTREFDRLYRLIAELRGQLQPDPVPPMCHRPEERP